MAEKTTHEEILDLLANKKITLDQAMQMINASSSHTHTTAAPAEEVHKAEILDDEFAPPTPPAEPEPIKILDDSPAPSAVKSNGNHKAGWLRIRVRELDSGRNRVTVNLPIGMVKFGLNMARRFSADSDDIDLDELAAQITDGEPGVLIDVQDQDSNEHVQISLA